VKILLIINNEKSCSKKVITFLKKKFTKLKVIDHNDFNNDIKNNFDYVLSYLSKKVLKKKFFNKTKKYNINFHPGPKKYPGIGCFNFALYNNEKDYGVTAHLIDEKIDSGKIIKERTFKIDKSYDVKKISDKSYNEMFLLLKEIVKMIIKNRIIFTEKKWERKAYTKKDLNKLAKIKNSYSKKKINKIIRCLYMHNKPAPFIIIKGFKFEYKDL
jgi:methionyl-tRNA formyltransferase